MVDPRNASSSGIRSFLAATPAAVGEAVRLARNFSTGAGLDSDAAARLAIVVEELVANLVDHGDLPEGTPIELEFSQQARGVILVLVDNGAPFDLRLAPEPGELPPERGGGAGLALVRAWAQVETYARVDDRNRLELWLNP